MQALRGTFPVHTWVEGRGAPRPRCYSMRMDFRGKLILAPLAGVTDTTFRRLCRENGAAGPPDAVADDVRSRLLASPAGGPR